MTSSQNALAAFTVLFGGGAASDWIAENRLFFGTIALVAIAVLFTVNAIRASRAK